MPVDPIAYGHSETQCYDVLNDSLYKPVHRGMSLTYATRKERVVDLLGRVCAVSAFTTNIVNELNLRSTIEQD